MTLSAGRRVGPYETTAPLGAGGMGEVYRAREFAPAANGTGLLSVPARGGELTTFLKREDDQLDFHKPSVLPDGRTLVESWFAEFR